MFKGLCLANSCLSAVGDGDRMTAWRGRSGLSVKGLYTTRRPGAMNGGRSSGDDADREHFLRAPAESVEQFEVRLYLFCLMINISQKLRKLAWALESDRLLRRQVTTIADDLKRRRDKLKH